MIAVTRNESLVRFLIPRVAWAALLVASLGMGCGFDPAAPAGAGGGGAASAPSTGGSSGATGVNGGSGGSASPLPTAGSGGSSGGSGGAQPQGGMPAGGAGGSGGSGGSSAGGSGGSGGMGVAGGPPAFSKKPLSVVAYSPYRDGQRPGGPQPTQAQVREDLVLLKPLVDGVRVYGTDGANAFVPALCDELGIELHIGAWIDGVASDGPNVSALATIVNQNHPSIKTAIIGNEVLARSAQNLMTEEKLIAFIEQAKAEITVPVTIAAADTFPQWMVGRPNLANSVDLLIWHTYGWWSGVDIKDAYTVVSGRYDTMLAQYPNKPMLLGETGWPSMYDHMSMDQSTTAVGSEENQAKFYREALAGFRARNLPMWMFSAIDEEWKAMSGEGMVGAYWGIFDTQRMPKVAATELINSIQP